MFSCYFKFYTPPAQSPSLIKKKVLYNMKDITTFTSYCMEKKPGKKKSEIAKRRLIKKYMKSYHLKLKSNL